MPLDLSYRQPSAEAVKKISDFARKTGDYASLSAVEIRVLAVKKISDFARKTGDYASLSA